MYILAFAHPDSVRGWEQYNLIACAPVDTAAVVGYFAADGLAVQSFEVVPVAADELAVQSSGVVLPVEVLQLFLFQLVFAELKFL